MGEPNEKVYYFDGIETEDDRVLVSNATFDINVLSERAEALLSDLMTVDFEKDAKAVQTDSYERDYFLSRYDEISAKIRSAYDAVCEANTIWDFISGVKTDRTERFINEYQRLTQFREFKDIAANA